MGLTCADCSKPMASNSKSLPQGKARCHPCRRNTPPTPKPQAKRGDLTCCVCGEAMWWSKSSLPQGQATCLPCRRVLRPRRPTANPKRAYTKRTPKTCVDCDAPTWSTRCRPCYDAHVKSQADPEAAAQRKRERAQRQRRDRAAPGLTQHQRRNLLALWRRQQRRCSYCDNAATQIDHVIPLALGGTNYEGNLTPCCASCNVRKSDSLLIEWKWKVRVRRQLAEPPALTVKVRVKRLRVGRQLPLFQLSDLGYYRAKRKTAKQCPKCHAVFHSHAATYCSTRCRPSTMSGAQQRKRRRERADPGGPIAA